VADRTTRAERRSEVLCTARRASKAERTVSPAGGMVSLDTGEDICGLNVCGPSGRQVLGEQG